MSRKTRAGALVSLLFVSLCTLAQNKAQLRTTDTEVTLEASDDAPRVTRFAFPGQPEWQNRNSEVLIPFVEIGGEQLACHWRFNSQTSHVDDQQVVFVYESESPHLRLSWEWRTRQTFGPL